MEGVFRVRVTITGPFIEGGVSVQTDLEKKELLNLGPKNRVFDTTIRGTIGSNPLVIFSYARIPGVCNYFSQIEYSTVLITKKPEVIRKSTSCNGTRIGFTTYFQRIV